MRGAHGSGGRGGRSSPRAAPAPGGRVSCTPTGLGSRVGADNWPPDPLADWWGLADGGDRLVQPYAWVAWRAPAGAGAFGTGAGRVRALLAARRWRVWDFIGSLLEPG